MTQPSPQGLPSLDQVLESLIQDRVCFFPVRHHSPACAWHIQHWIRTHRPTAILIEGPQDATDLIPFILHPKTQTPFAIYTTFVDRDQQISSSLNLAHTPLDPSPARFAGYYPFCDYSPELVALRTGAEIGATLKFIDLTYPEQVIHSYSQTDPTPRLRALQEEHHLKRSRYLQALARKTGCRDQDDLWDHLFEVSAQQISTPTFIKHVASYCYFARFDTAVDILSADGTLAREHRMAAQIAATLTETSGSILVITGGFHTVVLPQQILDPPPIPAKVKLKPDSAQTVLMRYTFEQLDALNGYGAGMPAPEYYHQIWQRIQSGADNAPIQAACDLIIEIGRLTRQKHTRLAQLSIADEIAALDQACRLAQFRHHLGPTREDLLDGLRSCFVKGPMDGEGVLLITLVHEILRGDRIGDLPPDAGVPPLVEDFRQRARTLKLKLETSLPQSLTLDIYRKRSHRQISRFLHQLRFLRIPYGTMSSGPDFVQGTGLDRIREQWETQWRPQTESSLIERSIYGTTLDEAALNRLREVVQELEEQGEGRSALASVKLLIAACRMGLQNQTEAILAVIDAQVAEDPDFTSLVQAIGQLTLLWQSREPLEAHGLDQLPDLAGVAYRRACYLLPQTGMEPIDQANDSLNSFSSLWEILNQSRTQTLDAELFISGLLDLLSDPQSNPVVLGGAVGILHLTGTLATPELITLAAGYLDSALTDPAAGIGFLRGILRTGREVAWRVPELLEALNTRLDRWDGEEFLKVLPELRLAFADLTPRETDKVAGIVAGLQGATDLGPLLLSQITEADLQLGLQLEQLMAASLQHDHLSGWGETDQIP